MTLNNKGLVLTILHFVNTGDNIFISKTKNVKKSTQIKYLSKIFYYSIKDDIALLK